MRKTARRQPPFVICIGRQGYPAALEVGKVYRVVPDPAATARGPLRVIDASGRNRVLLYGSKESPRKTQPASLLVTRDGAERIVRSFNCPQWDLNFVYQPFTRAERDLIANEGRTETIAVRMASH